MCKSVCIRQDTANYESACKWVIYQPLLYKSSFQNLAEFKVESTMAVSHPVLSLVPICGSIYTCSLHQLFIWSTVSIQPPRLSFKQLSISSPFAPSRSCGCLTNELTEPTALPVQTEQTAQQQGTFCKGNQVKRCINIFIGYLEIRPQKAASK